MCDCLLPQGTLKAPDSPGSDRDGSITPTNESLEVFEEPLTPKDVRDNGVCVWGGGGGGGRRKRIIIYTYLSSLLVHHSFICLGLPSISRDMFSSFLHPSFFHLSLSLLSHVTPFLRSPLSRKRRRGR